MNISIYVVNILSETDSLLILKSVSPYSQHFAAANGVHYMESLLYYGIYLKAKRIALRPCLTLKSGRDSRFAQIRSHVPR